MRTASWCTRMGRACRRRRGRGSGRTACPGRARNIRRRQARMAARRDPAPPSHRPANRGACRERPARSDGRCLELQGGRGWRDSGVRPRVRSGPDIPPSPQARRSSDSSRSNARVRGGMALALAGGRVTTWSAITWDAARAGGFLAYILLTLAVAAGLVLRNRWQSTRWPRFVTNELHGYLSLLALVFITVHVLAVLVDPFTRFGLAEILVPLWSHYRPVWMGLGTVALYLLVAVWLSSQLRARISHRTWRSDPCPCLRRLRSGDRAWTRNWKRHTYRLGAESVRNECCTRRCARGPAPARPVRTRRSAAAGTRCRRRALPRRHRRLGGRRASGRPLGGESRRRHRPSLGRCSVDL